MTKNFTQVYKKENKDENITKQDPKEFQLNPFITLAIRLDRVQDSPGQTSTSSSLASWPS